MKKTPKIQVMMKSSKQAHMRDFKQFVMDDTISLNSRKNRITRIARAMRTMRNTRSVRRVVTPKVPPSRFVFASNITSSLAAAITMIMSSRFHRQSAVKKKWRRKAAIRARSSMAKKQLKAISICLQKGLSCLQGFSARLLAVQPFQIVLLIITRLHMKSNVLLRTKRSKGPLIFILALLTLMETAWSSSLHQPSAASRACLSHLIICFCTFTKVCVAHRFPGTETDAAESDAGGAATTSDDSPDSGEGWKSHGSE
mmetsp:Transcript_136680/g.291965  ORF Transcript_136680/g.291965 Transcript_136680/m.291965 type:complete len:256 (-) Transcript_136680:37-804(-)